MISDQRPTGRRALTGTPGAHSKKNPFAERLTRLGASGWSGVLVASGDLQGEIQLVDGLIIRARCWVTPDAETMPKQEGIRDLMIREVVIDAVRELADGAAATRWRSRKHGGLDGAESTWIPVPFALAEVSRRSAVLSQLAGLVTQDTQVIRRARIDYGRVRISPSQWALLAATDSLTTSRALAHDLGDSIFRTVCRVAELLETGLLEDPSHPDGRKARPGNRFLDSLRADRT